MHGFLGYADGPGGVGTRTRLAGNVEGIAQLETEWIITDTKGECLRRVEVSTFELQYYGGNCT